MNQANDYTRTIRTNEGWMTFLVLTLVLLSASFYTVYYLNLRAQTYLSIPSVDDDINTLDIFDAKEQIIKKNTESGDGYAETKKDLKTLLEEKRRTANLDAAKKPSRESIEPDIVPVGLTEAEPGVKSVIKDSFFVVNKIFTYEAVFRPESEGDNNFLSDSNIYLFIEMLNLQEDAYGNISLAIDFKLKNDLDHTLPGYDARDLVVFKGKPPYKEGHFLARISIPLDASFKPGKYYTDLLIRDKVSGTTRAEKYVFKIKEPTL